jgi:hypothetical protein
MKNYPITRNPKTLKRIEDLQRKQQLFGEVQAASTLTPEALKLKQEEISRDTAVVEQALWEDNSRGELTKFGARCLAEAADRSAAKTPRDGQGTTYYAAGNQVKGIQVTGVRRKQIDTDLLAFVYFQEGMRMVKERRAKGLPQPKWTPEQQARLEKHSPELAKLRKQLQRSQERLRQHGINPDVDEPPEQLGLGLSDPPAP